MDLEAKILKTRIINKRLITALNCWEWTSYKNQQGYGRVRLYLGGRRRLRAVHRVFFEIQKEKVPQGFELDHLCRNRACFNPAHLEIVTHQENLKRALFTNAKKVACPKGHIYSGKNNRGRRICCICQKNYAKKYKEEKAACRS